MKLAFSTLGCPLWSIDHAIEQAAQLGYDGIEVRLLGSEIIPADLAAAERVRIWQLARDAGVALCCVSTSVRFRMPDEAARRENEALAISYLQLAADLGTGLVRVFGGGDGSTTSEADGIDRVADSLGRVSKHAEQLGPRIVLETHDDFAAARRVASVLARVNSIHVGALWDTHHPYRMGESPAEVMSLIGDRLYHLHVKDACRQDDGWQLVLLGEGEVPVRASLAGARAAGYDGWVAVEWEKKWHPEIEEPEIALPQHLQLLRQWLS